MKYRNKYRIESNRWQYWDYSAQGGYFITMCIENREAILGKIIDGKMHLSEYGEIVKNDLAIWAPITNVPLWTNG